MSDLLLLPSPLLPGSAYAGLAASLRESGVDLRLAPPTTGRTLDAGTLVRTWAALVRPGTTLVAHSNAGYLAPSVRSGAGTDARVVFLDAALPPVSGPTLLAPSRFRDHLASLVRADGLLPPWTRWWSREDLDGIIPAGDLDRLDRECPRLPLAYFDTELDVPPGWAGARNAYLAFGTTYAQEAALARELGWPCTVTAGGHLHFLFDPAGVAATILELVEELPCFVDRRHERPHLRSTAMTTYTDHDAYIAAAPEAFRPALERLRTVLARALPEAEEIVAYGMPGFRIGDSVVASYAAFSKQCGLYVLPGAIAGHTEEIAAAGLKATKTGITFSPRTPIPDDLVERLARTAREDAGRE